jgi:hypothetical protein
LESASGPPWSAVEYTSTHPHDVRLRRARADGNEVVSQCEMVGAGELPITVDPANSLALIVMREAILGRICPLARMLSRALRLAGAVALPGFRSVRRSDCGDRHS